MNQLIVLVNILNGLEMVSTVGVAALNGGIDEIVEEVEVPAKARLTRRNSEEEE